MPEDYTYALVEHIIKRYGLVYQGVVFKDSVQNFLIKQMETIMKRHLIILKLQKTKLIEVLTSLALENSKQNMVIIIV